MYSEQNKESSENDALSDIEFAKKTKVNLARPHLPFFLALFTMRFGGMSIIHRLYMCVGITFFLFLVATLVVTFMTSQVNDSLSRSGVRTVVSKANLLGNDILTLENAIARLTRNDGSTTELLNEITGAVSAVESNTRALSAMIEMVSDDQVKDTLQNKYFSRTKALVDSLVSSTQNITRTFQSDPEAAARLAYEQTSTCSMPALFQLRNLLTYLNNRSIAEQSVIDTMIHWVKYSLFLGLGIALCVIILTNITIRHSLRRDTGVLLRRLMAMAQGDLRDKVQLEASDEIGSIGKLVDYVVDNTNGTLTVVKNDVDKLYGLVNTNMRSIDATNEAISIQRNTAQSVASATSEMEVAVEKVTEFARSTLEEVKSAEVASDTCRCTMQDNITTTHTLSDRLRASSEAINKIHMMSNQIEAIVQTIADIADQTNLLSLNATIESARAGESGRGFAIVADEIRELAIRTAKSTKEVSNTINLLEKAVTNSVAVMASCESEMSNSLQQSSRANSSIEEIMGIIATISDMSEQIVMSCQQQSNSASEINSSIAHISKLAEDSYEQMHELQTNMHVLNDLATNQSAVIGKFRLNENITALPGSSDAEPNAKA